jgi:hypothetical protein
LTIDTSLESSFLFDTLMSAKKKHISQKGKFVIKVEIPLFKLIVYHSV